MTSKYEAFDPATVTEKKVQLRVDLTGSAGTGKTHFLCHSGRPLYIVSLDPKAEDLHTELLRAMSDGVEGEVYPLVLHVPSADDITREDATKLIQQVKDFARWARSQKKGGVFAVDGALYLKGVWEVALLGISSTLGHRGKHKGAGATQVQYAQSNTALKDFVKEFVGSDLDVIMAWEGRQTWGPKLNPETGKSERQFLGKYHSSSPDQMSYVCNVYIETARVWETKYKTEGGVKKPVGKELAYRIRIGPNNPAPNLLDVELSNIHTLEDLRRVLTAWMPRAAKEQQEAAAKHINEDVAPRATEVP